ncbi:MAG: thiamine pyrophosphate-binding protein [Streptosporangiales bacterium]|nr:thiamine pyrophosphate-binding protein [Streptosporangiales bacterium]
MNERVLRRADAVPPVLGDHEDFLIIAGLGSPCRDVAAVNGAAPNAYPLSGAMGAATPIGLGLALARPDRRVLVLTGEGELLMSVGALATVGVLDPGNLSILCVDNGHYGETGYQKSHTSRGVDLELMARGAGIRRTLTVAGEDTLKAGHDLIRETEHASFVLLRVDASEPAPARFDLNAAANRLRFREALLG